MKHTTLIRILKTAALLGATLLTSACTIGASPLDQALYTSGKGLGGYSRTIFSTNDF